MKRKQPRSGFELLSPTPFLTTRKRKYVQNFRKQTAHPTRYGKIGEDTLFVDLSDDNIADQRAQTETKKKEN